MNKALRTDVESIFAIDVCGLKFLVVIVIIINSPSLSSYQQSQPWNHHGGTNSLCLTTPKSWTSITRRRHHGSNQYTIDVSKYEKNSI